jgi:arsenical pump membrane protein
VNRIKTVLPPMWLVAALAGLIAVATGAVSAARADAIVERAGPILIFLVAVTVLAELADAAGVFDVAAGWAVQAARGRTLILFLLVVAMGTVTTVVLNLDTTAVLLTPVVLAMCAQLDLDPLPFALSTVWLANTTSVLLPVSNLTNLLAASRLQMSAAAFAGRMWLPTLMTLSVTVLALLGLHFRALRGRHREPSPLLVTDRTLLMVNAAACVCFAAMVLGGVNVTLAATAGAALTVLAHLVRRHAELRWSLVPWRLVLLVLGLFLVVEAARQHGLDTALSRVAGPSGDSVGGLLRLSGAAVAAANLANNLPAYLALEPIGMRSPDRLLSLLIGVNAGAVILPWGSLATLLWRERCRARGIRISWQRFVAAGLVLGPASVATAVVALRIS